MKIMQIVKNHKQQVKGTTNTTQMHIMYVRPKEKESHTRMYTKTFDHGNSAVRTVVTLAG